MVKVIVKDNDAFIWNADDWMKLRVEFRLLGTMYGCLANVPRQDVENGLPLKLLPEEATLIHEENIGKLLSYKNPSDVPSDDIKKKYHEYSERVKNEQVEYCEEKRKKEVLSMIDRIVEGKRRKLAKSDSTAVVDRDAIIESEMEKIKSTDFLSGINVQIPTEHPWFNESNIEPAQWDYPKTELEKLKYKVFKDLWKKGYFLGPGVKFGGHFLVYPGDPLKFHAFFIVLCVLSDEEIPLSKIVMHSRLGTVTKKTFVIASDKEDSIVYNSFEWTGLS